MRILLGAVSFLPWFCWIEFTDASGTGPQWTRDCVFRQKSSSLNRALTLRLSVQLNSWDNFFVTLPSIAHDTWKPKFYFLLGGFVFRVWLFLIWSFLTLLMAATFFDSSDFPYLKTEKWTTVFWEWSNYLTCNVVEMQ